MKIALSLLVLAYLVAAMLWMYVGAAILNRTHRERSVSTRLSILFSLGTTTIGLTNAVYATNLSDRIAWLVLSALQLTAAVAFIARDVAQGRGTRHE